jgi:hypothetical protein
MSVYTDEIYLGSNKIYRINDTTVGVMVNNTNVATIGTNGITVNVPAWHIADQKANNTPGGTFSSGAWQRRDLNTTIGSNTISGSSLASNQFTLPAGTYRIFVSAPAFNCNRHKAKLRNMTDSSDTLIGSSEYSAPGGYVQSSSIISGTFTISSQKTFEIQHQTQNTASTNGLGVESNFGVAEIYTQVQLWRLA